jgi:ketosteroid isomerase-like protein
MAGEADELRAIERERLAAIVAGDTEAMERLHARDFALINPAGQQMTRQDYLGGLSAGFIAYTRWEPESSIEVAVYGDGAVLHYRAVAEVSVQGEVQPVQHFWETAVYEKRVDGWQVVWSQATRQSL